MEAVALISSTKFSEKQVGYIATSVLLHENLEFVRLVINTMQKDLLSRDENYQCMALTAIANMGGREFAEALSGEVLKLLTSSSTRTVVRKKAALCVLRLFRRNPDIVSVDTFALKLCNLLQERDLGALLSSMSLLCGVVSHNPEGYVLPQRCALPTLSFVRAETLGDQRKAERRSEMAEKKMGNERTHSSDTH